MLCCDRGGMSFVMFSASSLDREERTMVSKKETVSRITYKFHKTFVKIAYIFLIIGACLTIGASVGLLYKAHKTVIVKTDRYITELSQSVSSALEQRFQRTFGILESVVLSCNQENTLSADELEGLQKRAGELQFEYFAFVSPDGSAICSDGVSRTFTRHDAIMKAFEGQSVIDVKVSETAVDGQNKNMPFFAIPIYSQSDAKKITGVLAAPISPQRTDFFLLQSYYGGDVFFNVIKSDGTEVFMTKRSHVSRFEELQGSDETNNLFDTLYANVEVISDTTIGDLREAASSGRNATIRFRLPHDQLTQTAQLTHIGDTNLCIWMVDTNDAVSGGLDQILHRAFWVNGLGVICFGALTIVLIFLYRKITFLLMVDPISNGYSPARFKQEAEQLIYHSAPGEYTFIVFNIVDFKLLNDTYGYYESNCILKHIHNTILKYMENGEILVRSSADEFNVLIHTIPNEQILQKLKLIVEEINKFNAELSEKQWLMFSTGVYQITDTGLPFVHIRDRANIARKKSKRTTEHILYSCGFYEEEDRSRLQQENIIKNKMNDALKNQDFKVYLQPKVKISTGKIIGAEALVRWQDTDMGLVPPNEFIPLFEKIGFIRRLDFYMFEQVCICLRRWLDAGFQPVPVSVNLSRLHLTNKDFLSPFIEVQKKYCIPPELLELELTETAFQDYPDVIPEAIHQIHNAGYTCSLDDFGSGYSSLNNLEALDIDILKLDCKFLRAARVKNDKGHIVIEELIHMARRLGITVCCEGVETEAQLAFLKECHCDKGQGYLFSRPIEVPAFEELVYGLHENSR